LPNPETLAERVGSSSRSPSTKIRFVAHEVDVAPRIGANELVEDLSRGARAQSLQGDRARHDLIGGVEPLGTRPRLVG
jgi:hypothetical protein